MTLERLYGRIARGPTPAGVSVAAICAGLALGLAVMTLEATARRTDVAATRRRAVHLRRTAKVASAKFMRLAQQDAAAFDAYLEARRNMARDGRKPAKLKLALSAALRKATQLPLKIAREAVSGLKLCADAAQLVRREVAADLEAAALILSTSARVALGSARSNIGRLDRNTRYYAEMASQGNEIERQAHALLNRALAGTSHSRFKP